MGKINSKAKGDAGEREFIKEFKLVFGVELKRNKDQDAYGGDDFTVANVDSDIAKYINQHYSIECKRRKKVLESDKKVFWEQALLQAKKISKIFPIVVYREDYGKWKAIYPLIGNEFDETVELSLTGLYKWIKCEMGDFL